MCHPHTLIGQADLQPLQQRPLALGEGAIGQNEHA